MDTSIKELGSSALSCKELQGANICIKKSLPNHFKVSFIQLVIHVSLSM